MKNRISSFNRRAFLKSAMLGGIALTMVAAGHGAESTYRPGGPLAGVELPPNPRSEGFSRISPGGDGSPYGTRELYPGSVENALRPFPLFDRHTQLQRFSAPALSELGGGSVERYDEPVGGYIKNPETAKVPPPVDVIRSKAGMKPIAMNFGKRGPGMYCLRVIGAVQTDKLRPFREPLYVEWKVNDGEGGKESHYRRRIGYVDEFFSVEELFLHLSEEQDLKVEFSVGDGSKVDLLVADIVLDDALAGVQLKPWKTKQTLVDPNWYKAEREAARKELEGLDPAQKERWLMEQGWGETTWPKELLAAQGEANWARDAVVWRRLLPPEHQLWSHGWSDTDSRLRPSTLELNPDAFEEKYGTWVDGTNNADDTFLVNKKLDLKYTYDDAWNFRPLPEPYPFRDLAGSYFPDPADPKKGAIVAPFPVAMYWSTIRRAVNDIDSLLGFWAKTGEERVLRDAAVRLIHFAYNYPAYEQGQTLNSFITTPSFNGKDTRFRDRHSFYIVGEYTGFLSALDAYDKLFPYIQGNEDLAKSIQRFVPWVKTSKDVTALIDGYLVQNTARRILRGLYDTGGKIIILPPAMTLANKDLTDQWLTGFIPDISNAYTSEMDRNGVFKIGSTFYATGGMAVGTALTNQTYRDAVPDTKFSVDDPVTYPKQLSSALWPIDIIVGGYDFPRIGDVTGPDKQPGRTIDTHIKDSPPVMEFAWNRTRSPRIAWILVHLIGRGNQTDAQWAEIEAAAALQKRAPWLDNRSRFVENWFGVLETGHQHDDWRFRRAAYVRTGYGSGHAHSDLLDLQIFAHGLPFLLDDGQRGSGYSAPKSSTNIIHNLVAVTGPDDALQSNWVRVISDADGARYLSAKATGYASTKTYERQIALIDVDEGEGSVPLTPDQMLYNRELPKIKRTANSYVFDVFRVEGGGNQAYCIHGFGNDFAWNATEEKKPAAGSVAAEVLAPFNEATDTWKEAKPPEVLQATWKIPRDWEKEAMQKAFDPDLPPAFQRVHLLDTDGKLALGVDIISKKYGYRMAQVMLNARGENLSNAFPVIIEPYRGVPFIQSVRALPIEENEPDALRAVAVEVKLTSGRKDLCFADGRPDQLRKFKETEIQAEFAFVSRDKKGVRQAVLSGGTNLSAPGIKIQVPLAERKATILAVDYPGKSLTVAEDWTHLQPGDHVEIGNAQSATGFTVASAERTPDGGTKITFTHSAQAYRGKVNEITTDRLKLAHASANVRAGMTITNEDFSKKWTVKQPHGVVMLLNEALPVLEDFGKSGIVSAWEYATGDEIRQDTMVNVTRLADGKWLFEGNISAEITIKGETKKFAPIKAGEKNQPVSWSNQQ